MKVTWLAQAGILLERGGVRIMIDPYFSDCVHKMNPEKKRRYPPEMRYLSPDPHVLIFTHDHIDHYDPETAPLLLKNASRPMTVLCPSSVWQKARREGGSHNYVQFNRGTEWTEYGFRLMAVYAEHSDPWAIGVWIEDLETDRSCYITGDTLYSRRILDDLPAENVDVIFLPINGEGNNMNMADAARLADAVGARQAVPFHYGLYDTIDPLEFPCPVRRIAIPFKEFEL